MIIRYLVPQGSFQGLLYKGTRIYVRLRDRALTQSAFGAPPRSKNPKPLARSWGSSSQTQKPSKIPWYSRLGTIFELYETFLDYHNLIWWALITSPKTDFVGTLPKSRSWQFKVYRTLHKLCFAPFAKDKSVTIPRRLTLTAYWFFVVFITVGSWMGLQFSGGLCSVLDN